MGGLVDAIFGGSDPPPPPDYTPVAQASKEAAEISAALGREQLGEARRQYDLTMEVTRPVVNAQLEVMRQGIRQGDDYYEYGKSFRPLELQMAQQAAAGTGADPELESMRRRAADFEGTAAADIALATGGNGAIADKFAADIEGTVGTAVADARVGQTQALNTAMRQAMRYGLTVPTNAQAVTNQNAAQLAAAANNTRTAAIDRYRDIVAQGINLKRDAFTTSQAADTAARSMRVQNDSLDWAKKLDVTGMVRGMPGASQGAYGLAVGAGSSAAQAQAAPGQALVSQMGQSAGTTMQGRQVAMQGLTGILNAQQGYANTVAQANSANRAANMDLIGTGLGMAFSDARLKRDIVKLRDDPRGFGWYEFEYVWGGGRRVGVMAHEVQAVVPAAVVEVAGYLAVDYSALA